MPKGLKKAFTEEGVARMSAPRGTRREIGDAVQRGLVLRIGETGVKSWSVIYKVPGERGVSPTGRPLKGSQKRITIGQYPMVGVRPVIPPQRAATQGKSTRRTCLRCRVSFNSTGAGNRLCDKCRQRAAAMSPFEPG